MRLTAGRVFFAIGIAATAGAIGWSLVPKAIPVETAQVVSGRFVTTIDESGKTRVRERYLVAAPLAGRSTRINLKVGDTLARGDTIASILPIPAPLLDLRSRREAEERLGAAEAARERTRAILEKARAQSSQAQSDLARTRILSERGAAATQALERADLATQIAERDLRAAEFQDHAAEHEINQARALLARYDQTGDASLERWNITAPVSGVVLKVLQESETVVAPGTPLMEIGDPRDLEVVVDVLSADAVEIQPGAEVMIEQWGGSGTLAGRVRRIEPIAFTKISTLGVEEQRANVLIDVISSSNQWAGLGDGYRIEARIVVFERQNTTIIPAGALFRIGSAWHVYAVNKGRAERRAVDVIRRSGGKAAIAQGLSIGEAVIVYPSDRVEPNARVESH